MAQPIKPSGSGESWPAFIPTLAPEFISQLESLSLKTSGLSIGDSDAEILMNLWSKGTRIGENKYSIPNDFSSRQIAKLKVGGLVLVDGNRFEFTQKAKNVIKTMVLGEQNKFMEKRQKKPYSMILAESKRQIRTSNLTHTAQETPTRQVPYVYSRRVALINQSTNNFKEYTARVFLVAGRFEVWTFHGRIGGTQVPRFQRNWSSRYAAQRHADEIISTKIDKGYRDGADWRTVRSPTGVRYDLSIENPSIPGVPENAGRNVVNEMGEIEPRFEEDENGNRAVTDPRRPSSPAVVPATPQTVPTAHIEDRQLPGGYAVQGPVYIPDDHISRRTGDGVFNVQYYLANAAGIVVPESAGRTPADAVKNGTPWMLLMVAEERLPPGYTMVGPPREDTIGGLFLVRTESGNGVAISSTAEEAANLAIAAHRENAGNDGSVENKDPVFKKQQNETSGLAEELPQGFRFDYEYDISSRQYIWKIVNKSGAVVHGPTSEKSDEQAISSVPKNAFDIFQKIRAENASRIADEYIKRMNERMSDDYAGGASDE